MVAPRDVFSQGALESRVERFVFAPMNLSAACGVCAPSAVPKPDQGMGGRTIQPETGGTLAGQKDERIRLFTGFEGRRFFESNHVAPL
jgi:hypothetical protein